MNKLKYFLLAFLVLILLPNILLAQDSKASEDSLFYAKVLEILDEKEIVSDNGAVAKQQDIKLLLLSGPEKDQEVVYQGISQFSVVSQGYYQVGDKVLVNKSQTDDGRYFYDITDYVRLNGLAYLFFIFVLLVIIIAKWKGLKALLSLFFSILVIMKFMIPNILAGFNPFWVALIGALFILIFIIYFTEGLNKKSNLAVLSIVLVLLAVGVLTLFFEAYLRLSGMSNEESMLLVGLTEQAINFRGLLLAGILLGTLGVLDDVVISQISAVEELKKADHNFDFKNLYHRGINIGKSHLASMINTLFLAYAGAALPLLILFSLKTDQWLTPSLVINNEMIATEILRTLVGSIGILLAVPISTYLAAKYFAKKS